MANLGTEFIRYSDTDSMNKLVTDSIYDQQLAERITFNSLWHWGYREYLDIYKAVWELNRSLPEDAPKFKVFGIESDMDFSFVQSEEDFGNPEIMSKVFKSASDFEEEEGYSAHAIQKEVLDKKQKALVHCGIHHGFTSYYQPNVVDGKFVSYTKERMGNLIKNKMGPRTMTIFMHGPWYAEKGYDENMVLPVDGVLDRLFASSKNRQHYPFGMDTKGTLIGELKGKSSIYKHGYPDFTLKDFCDGYIFLKPVNELKTVTPIKNFVKPDKVDFVKQQELDFRNKALTAENLNDTISVWLSNLQAELKDMQ